MLPVNKTALKLLGSKWIPWIDSLGAWLVLHRTQFSYKTSRSLLFMQKIWRMQFFKAFLNKWCHTCHTLKLDFHMVVNTHPKRASLVWFVYILEQVEGRKSGGNKLQSNRQTVMFRAWIEKLKDFFDLLSCAISGLTSLTCQHFYWCYWSVFSLPLIMHCW